MKERESTTALREQALKLESEGKRRSEIAATLNTSKPNITRILGPKQKWRDRRNSSQ